MEKMIAVTYSTLILCVLVEGSVPFLNYPVLAPPVVSAAQVIPLPPPVVPVPAPVVPIPARYIRVIPASVPPHAHSVNIFTRFLPHIPPPIFVPPFAAAVPPPPPPAPVPLLPAPAFRYLGR